MSKKSEFILVFNDHTLLICLSRLNVDGMKYSTVDSEDDVAHPISFCPEINSKLFLHCCIFGILEHLDSLFFNTLS